MSPIGAAEIYTKKSESYIEFPLDRETISRVDCVSYIVYYINCFYLVYEDWSSRSELDELAEFSSQTK